MSEAKKHEAADSLSNPVAAEELAESDATLTESLTVSGDESAESDAAAQSFGSLQQLSDLANTAPDFPSPESSDHSAQLQYFSAMAGINFLTVTQLFTWAITHQAEFTAIVDGLRDVYNKIKLLAPTFPKVFSADGPCCAVAPPTLKFRHVFGSHSAQNELAAAMKEFKVAGGIESARDWFEKIMKYLPAILKVIAIFAEEEPA